MCRAIKTRSLYSLKKNVHDIMALLSQTVEKSVIQVLVDKYIFS